MTAQTGDILVTAENTGDCAVSIKTESAAFSISATQTFMGLKVLYVTFRESLLLMTPAAVK